MSEQEITDRLLVLLDANLISRSGFFDYSKVRYSRPKTPLLQFVEETFLARQGHATTYAFPNFDAEQATELREVRRPRGDPLLPARL